MNKEQITAEVLTAFQLPEAGLKELAPYGSGHINDTFRVTYETENKTLYSSENEQEYF